MNWNFFKSSKKEAPQKSQPQAFSEMWRGDNLVPFDGEKTPFELGTPYDYKLDYYGVRLRSWKAYMDSDILQNAIKKYLLWISGAGLKLQATPQKVILENENINFQEAQFESIVEAYFRTYAKQKSASYSNEWNLHKSAKEALKNAIISGDVLCIIRMQGGQPNIEIVDGYHVQSPLEGKWITQAESRGNKIEHGVELNKRGTHIAYYIHNGDFQYQRITARNSRGQRKAWLMYGLNYKLDTVRGMSLLTAILETASKIDRYKDASLGSAEENSKVPYTIEHNMHSTGENPMINQLAQSMGRERGVAPETDAYNQSEPVATKIAQSTSKQTYNMPIGSKLARNSFQTDINFAEFFDKNSDIVYSTFGIPPEIAADKFGGSYSGSRAALKSWEYKMMTDREELLGEQFYRNFYYMWLNVNVLLGKVREPDYLDAYFAKNETILSAYRQCRFIGATVPHIDPYKEVNAERLKLGENFRTVPLTTLEQAMEMLNTGDSLTVLEKAMQEMESAQGFMIETEQNTEE